MVLRNIHQFHDDLIDLLLCGPIFAMDGVIIPIFSLVIGSLYLCTSQTIGDVILNSCAVAFVGDIDNFILEMNNRMNSMAGVEDAIQDKLYVPVNLKLIKYLNWLMCVVPIVPCICSYALIHIGVSILHL